MSDDVNELKRLLADANGRALAAARDRDQVRREADKIKAEASAYREETDNMIATAGDQLKIAMAISSGIFYLGQWANSILEQKALAARTLYREEKTWIENLSNLTSAVESDNQPEIDRIIKLTKKQIAIVRGNSEALRLMIEEDAQAIARKAIKGKLEELLYPAGELALMATPKGLAL